MEEPPVALFCQTFPQVIRWSHSESRRSRRQACANWVLALPFLGLLSAKLRSSTDEHEGGGRVSGAGRFGNIQEKATQCIRVEQRPCLQDLQLRVHGYHDQADVKDRDAGCAQGEVLEEPG